LGHCIRYGGYFEANCGIVGFESRKIRGKSSLSKVSNILLL
jgi:hypothetical protein